jgi:apolipoprotein N-acyltransferase
VTRKRGPGLVAALAGGLLLGWATPPSLLGQGAVLVVAGLMLWFVVATASSRPLLHGYLYGAVHMAWFSWSVRHVVLPAYVAIVCIGGLYYALANLVVRSTPRRWQPVAFALSVAAVFHLRAVMPEICYPHGQPCHALWQLPAVLGVVTVGGEPLANVLLAALAANLVVVFRSWRLAEPPLRRAFGSIGLVAASWAGLAVLGAVVRGSVAPTDAAALRVAAVEPGFHPIDEWRRANGPDGDRAMMRLFEQRFLEPTRGLLRGGDAPELVLWPESSVPDTATEAEFRKIAASLVHRLGRAPATLLFGANAAVEGGSTPTAVAVRLADGVVLGRQDKRRLVPGGEVQPFLWLLPDALGAPLRRFIEDVMGAPPDAVPGGLRPPIELPGGVRLGSMLCYDNAFLAPAADQVRLGARVLVVLSNEAWYRHGGELTQLVAMTVVRALENATPIVRCTQDGWTCVVGADGRLGASLPPGPTGAARILSVSIPLAAGFEPPLAWLRRAAGLALLVGLGCVLAHLLVRRVRLRTARTAPPAAAAQ